MILRWLKEEVPSDLTTRQVYGVIFTRDGRVLLKLEDGKYSLAGGTPEDFDEDRVATLKRELVEEVNTTIEEPIMLGYQYVDEENGKTPYAQVRMVALIDTIGEIKPDPDNGKVYQRILVTPSRAIELLKCAEIGNNLLTDAPLLAREKFGITTYLDKEEFI